MKSLVTKEGLSELERELAERKVVVRDQIATEIEKAREQGDLSENAAYKAAMDKKEFNEMRISQLEEMINNSEVVAGTQGKSRIGLGSKAKVVNETLNKEFVFEVVGQSEADPANGKISIKSPLGEAMNGKRVQEEFKFITPAGEHVYKVLEII
jgi:transcription elongation factor GreA